MLEMQRSVHNILLESWLKWIFKHGVRRQVTQGIHRVEKQVRKSSLPATRQIPKRQAEAWKASAARVGQVRATEKLDFEAGWKEEVALYMNLEMPGKPEDMKVTVSLYLIGTGGSEFCETLPSASAPSDRTLAQFIKAFDGRCDPKKSETVERYKFFTRFQKQGESFEKFITELRILAATCNFDTLHDSLLRDRIIYCILDSHLREELLKEQNLYLAKCIQIGRAAELSKERKEVIETNESIHSLKNKTSSSYSNRKRGSNASGRKPETFGTKRTNTARIVTNRETVRRMAKRVPTATK